MNTQLTPKYPKRTLEEIRKLRGFTTTEVAEKVGMTKEYYEKIENDARRLSAYDACKIAIAYQYPIDSIDFKFED